MFATSLIPVPVKRIHYDIKLGHHIIQLKLLGTHCTNQCCSDTLCSAGATPFGTPAEQCNMEPLRLVPFGRSTDRDTASTYENSLQTVLGDGLDIRVCSNISRNPS